MTIFLETKHLVVKAPTLTEAGLVFTLDSDPDVMQFIGNGNQGCYKMYKQDFKQTFLEEYEKSK